MQPNANSPAGAVRPIGTMLAEAARQLGHAPLLTFYDDVTGEQTELSYATFDNWVSKAANLLSEEMDLTRGGRLVLGVAEHWTGAVLAAAAWKVGAAVVLDATGRGDVVVVNEDDAASATEQLLVVGTGMGGRVAGDPPGVHFGDEVLAFADDYDDPDVTADDLAVIELTRQATHAHLVTEATLPAGARALSLSPLSSARALIEMLVAPIAAGGSVVWCPRAGGADLTDRLATERVTHRFNDGVGGSGE